MDVCLKSFLGSKSAFIHGSKAGIQGGLAEHYQPLIEPVCFQVDTHYHGCPLFSSYITSSQIFLPICDISSACMKYAEF